MRINVDIDALAGDINRRLDPESIAIDGRDMRDRLAFVAAIADLIVFYDEHNQAAGNWRALVLKEPAILLAVIGKTPYQPLHFRFNQLQERLKQFQALPAAATPNTEDKQAVAHLFSLLDSMFVQINTWHHYLPQSAVTFPLQKFVSEEVNATLSPCLWRRVDMQIWLAQAWPDCTLPGLDLSAFGDAWQFRGAQFSYPRSPQEVMSTLERLYQQVFSFFVQVITHANKAFDALSEEQNGFPDTALIIAFNRLLEFSRTGLNTFSGRHLDFYYQQLLHQQQRMAQPDHTVICLTPVEGISPVILPAGTPFLAGQDPQKQPIIFASQQPIEINTARPGPVISCRYAEDDNGDWQQYVNTLAPSNQVRRGADNTVLASDWFGNRAPQTQTQGFAFASPMLWLAGGAREVSLTFTFAQTVDPKAWQGAAIALSGAQQWLDATACGVWQRGDKPQQLVLTVNLNSAFPPVSAFTAVPPAPFDMTAPWCRITMPAKVDLRQPPRLLSLTIAVNVTQSEALSLSNDNGPLVADKVMPVFGPIPEVGHHCYLNAPELFGKPLTTLSLQLFWDNQPPDFARYYATWNHWADEDDEEAKTWSNSAFRVTWQANSAMGWQILPAMLTIVPPSDDAPPPPESAARRSWWQRIWQRLHSTPHTFSPTEPQLPGGLFAQQETGKTCLNAPSSTWTFRFPTALAWNMESASTGPGMRMTLIAPGPGFGFNLYPQLVADISLENAKALMSLFGKSDTTPMPNLPWVPKANRALVNYQASQYLDFTRPLAANNAFTLIHQGTLTDYCYFRKAAGEEAAQISLATMALQPDAANTAGLALFQGVNQAAGSLFFSLAQVVVPCRLSLFIELTQEADPDGATAEIQLFYWSVHGWQPLSVVSDETGGLRRSGIMVLDLPQDMALDSAVLSATVTPGQPCGWLLMTQNVAQRVQVVYCNTLAARVQRQLNVTLSPGEQPKLPAGSIVAPLITQPAIAGVIQPFDSIGGSPAEDPVMFRQRVSQRLRTKDRLSSQWDSLTLTREVYPNAFYTRMLPTPRPGDLCVGVIPRYDNAGAIGALRPAVSPDGLQLIQQYLSRRVSAMAQVSVCNLQYEPVQVIATLVIGAWVNANDLLHALNQGITLFLSPWIDAAQVQYSLSLGVSHAAVLSFLASFDGVAAVQRLQLCKSDADNGEEKPATDGLLVPSDARRVLVSALTHQLTFIRANNDGPARVASATLSMPQNTLSEAW
ncbi:hypothetical protein R0H17_01705 [Phytobacter diazotrophicus]|uniref:hypothetical protein n=1 Tax=Phytobacter diazotrophicus TaxID=395631 RepID=UPI0029358775|nr:hypothetical protein [Phytobacter diazotrophicus]MDV2900347.1 hypothetical protein [Phytobacter diazotrophicus]